MASGASAKSGKGVTDGVISEMAGFWDVLPAHEEELKAILQSVQSPASSYFNALSALTLPQVIKGQRLQEAFQQVLDEPGAADALQHPALKPLLELAAD